MTAPLTPEQRVRQAAGNSSAKGRQGKAASPWAKGPHSATAAAKASHMRYCKRGKSQEAAP